MSGPSPCAACTKRCCSNYTVSVTGFDAWLIGTHLHLPLESFLVYYAVSEPHARGFLLDPGGPRYEIALDKVGRFAKGNPCVFWVDLLNGRGRCGIYAFRPYVCQTYPAYQEEDTVALRSDVLCPMGSWNLAGMDLLLFRRRLYRFRMEQDIYAYVVGAWNRDVRRTGTSRGVHEYYAYVMNVYGRIDHLRLSHTEETLADVAEVWGRQDDASPNPLVADMISAAEESDSAAVIASIRASIDQLSATFDESARRAPV